ncbi:MSCRAMM family protein [Streptomyces melanogenes]|uniref:MSCRAMM family protein n=1 Tax=Streptomyces melanogenes TaxID=67326 RepID=UPI003570D7F7
MQVRKADKNTGKALAGAVIAIRADEEDKTGKHTPGRTVLTLSTGADGTARTPLDVTLKASTRYWATEVKAPTDYQLDSTPVAFTARPDADVAMTLADKPTPAIVPPHPSTPGRRRLRAAPVLNCWSGYRCEGPGCSCCPDVSAGFGRETWARRRGHPLSMGVLRRWRVRRDGLRRAVLRS